MPKIATEKMAEKARRQAVRAQSRERREQAGQSRAKRKKERAPAMVPPVAAPATIRKRHWGIFIGFVLLVILPTVLVYWYLSTRAADQYASTVGFSVRNEEAAPALDLLGGVSGFSSGGASDTDILYEFIQSQQLVSAVNDQLDLYSLFSKPENDPVFAFDPDQPIEALVAYWPRMVKIYYDAGTGLIELRVLAFDPQDAQEIAQAIFDQSSLMINALNAAARADATRYARDELDQAVERLKAARQALITFRNENQIVDPSADIQGQMGLLNTLQTQLAEALINLDLLRDVTSDSDPRIEQATRKIAVIEARITDERSKFGITGDAGAYASLIGQFEALSVDQEFAQSSYLAALASYDNALSEANRQSRYLAAYIRPTLAQSSQYPDMLTLTGLAALFLFLIWTVGVLVIYAIRDRR